MVEVRRFKMAGFGGFADDIAREGRAASNAGRSADKDRLHQLWFDYFETTLPAMGDAKLIDYFESRPVWREESDWLVYRTPDQPSIAFTAVVDPQGGVEIIALAACDRFPGGSDEEWWLTVVRPRLLQL